MPISLIFKLIIWNLTSRISYWLYNRNLPSFYGHLTGWYGQVVYYQKFNKTVEDAIAEQKRQPDVHERTEDDR